jgi:hypothetical protein
MQFKGHVWADAATMTLALEINGGSPILLNATPDTMSAEPTKL